MEILLLLWFLSRAKGTAPTPGQQTTIRARDGSSHRLQFVTAKDKKTGKSSSGWIALSTDTGLRFKPGEEATILGRSYKWNAARPLRGKAPAAFSGGAFL
jgi:hypothetical protein